MTTQNVTVFAGIGRESRDLPKKIASLWKRHRVDDGWGMSVSDQMCLDISAIIDSLRNSAACLYFNSSIDMYSMRYFFYPDSKIPGIDILESNRFSIIALGSRNYRKFSSILSKNINRPIEFLRYESAVNSAIKLVDKSIDSAIVIIIEITGGTGTDSMPLKSPPR